MKIFVVLSFLFSVRVFADQKISTFIQTCHLGTSMAIHAISSEKLKQQRIETSQKLCAKVADVLKKDGTFDKVADVIDFSCGNSVGGMFKMHGLTNELSPPSMRFKKIIADCQKTARAESSLVGGNEKVCERLALATVQKTHPKLTTQNMHDFGPKPVNEYYSVFEACEIKKAFTEMDSPEARKKLCPQKESKSSCLLDYVSVNNFKSNMAVVLIGDAIANLIKQSEKKGMQELIISQLMSANILLLLFDRDLKGNHLATSTYKTQEHQQQQKLMLKTEKEAYEAFKSKMFPEVQKMLDFVDSQSKKLPQNQAQFKEWAVASSKSLHRKMQTLTRP